MTAARLPAPPPSQAGHDKTAPATGAEPAPPPPPSSAVGEAPARDASAPAEQPPPRRLGRRAFLGGAGLVGAGGIAGAVAGGLAQRGTGPAATPVGVARERAQAVAAVRPGLVHQPGIVEPPPAHLVFTAYDLTSKTSVAGCRAALTSVLTAWTGAARTLMTGAQPAAAGGRALGLAPSALTVTIGLGPSALRLAGLTSRIPPQLAPIPGFPHDHLDAARSGGDIAVQICAEDPMVVVSAARYLDTLAKADATPRWTQHGFRRTAAAAADPTGTPRNLMGQLDGTDNPVVGTPDFDQAVWADSTAPAWMAGGSYLVARRIRMDLDRWDLISTSGQEQIIGRSKATGAPLTGGSEHTDPDFTATGSDGNLEIPANAHIRLAHPQSNNGVRMLRRGYSYHDGLDAAGQLDAGLFFLAYQADPLVAFTAIQSKLDRLDALSAFIRHTGSALFAIPAAAPTDGYVGQQLLEG
ncbi:Dyp-type peroxidase [Pseudofrankia sp. DC12]|uniref:Dyp-type peroxidase n=1 Tax=Pseudofrankia sp. DC12 TaxID=683315 RepID=UPI000A8A61BF|nr:Dyp-type peroxidase [Pseudofrankia sp. DC12]